MDALEESIFNDLWSSGAIDEQGYPHREGLTIDDLAKATPASKEDIERKLKELLLFDCVPYEIVGHDSGPDRYRLIGKKEAEEYRENESRNPGWWDKKAP